MMKMMMIKTVADDYDDGGGMVIMMTLCMIDIVWVYQIGRSPNFEDAARATFWVENDPMIDNKYTQACITYTFIIFVN